MKELKIETKRGTLLDGVLFGTGVKADTVLICITGIHGNFYSNPFYYNIGDTLTAAGIDFIYAQTNDAFGAIRTQNVRTGQEEIIGSWNERFALTDEDIAAYLDYAERQGYKHIILAGHSLGANKVIYYLSRHHDTRVEHFLLLSPANLDYMTSSVTPQQREIIHQFYERGDAEKMLPFLLMGWVECTVGTAYDWVWSGLLNNVHTRPDGDFSQVSRITHTGALLIGTYDNFTDGDPSGFLRNINSHMPTADQNRLLFIERTGHTYQQKQQELADKILQLIKDWKKRSNKMPFIISRTNRSISREQERQLKNRLGKAIELVPGKSEQYLMLGFEDNCHLYLRGDDSQPMVYIEASIWGNETHLGYDKFTAEVTHIFHDVLGIAPDCIYIRYSDIPDWGVAGHNFDRNKYL